MTLSKKINLNTIKLLFGSLDANAKLIERQFEVRLHAREGELAIEGEADACEKANSLVDSLIALIARGEEIDPAKVRQTIDILAVSAQGEEIENVVGLAKDVVTVTAKGKQIKCKTLGQRHYVKLIKSNTVVFGIGPAGTGKTYLAVALAYAAFKAGDVTKIILTRPALEAGEKLGFLPGDMQDKIDPYLRPLYDALSEMFGQENYTRLMERGDIEVAPLAFMRGRTLSGAFIILDEAQNTTEEQMKMFLTRLGSGSKMIVTGDQTQIDLPFGKSSGLNQAAHLLKDINDIAVCYLSDKDVVRHELVQKIVLAYAEGGERERPNERDQYFFKNREDKRFWQDRDWNGRQNAETNIENNKKDSEQNGENNEIYSEQKIEQNTSKNPEQKSEQNKIQDTKQKTERSECRDGENNR